MRALLPANLHSIRAACAASGVLQSVWTHPAAVAVAGPRHHLTSSSSSTSRSSSGAAWLPQAAAAEARSSSTTRSAAESAAAMQEAQVEALMSVGLNHTAADAVARAWNSGRVKRFKAGTPLLFSHLAANKVAVSPKRGLACVRRLIRAHQAAAAAAGVQQAERLPLQQLPGGRRRRTAAAAAQQEQPAAPAGKLDWGVLDIQRVVAQEPALVVAPVAQLARGLTHLIDGLTAVLGRDLALQYVHRSPTLRLQLADPQAALDKLRARYDAYVEVFGQPPRLALLAASESSHMKLTVGTFKQKLQHFADRWGVESAHATLSDQPHLLSSKLASMDGKSQALQQLLGCNEQQLARLVRRAPRLLSTDSWRVVWNLQELTTLLQPLDIRPGDMLRLVLKVPALLVSNPVTTASKFEAVKELLGPSAYRLRSTIWQQPSLLGYHPQTLLDRRDGLQQLLGCSRVTVCGIITRCPCLLMLDPNAHTMRLNQLADGLGMPLSEVKVYCCREPILMVLTPELIIRKLEQWAGDLQLEKATVVAAVMAYPRMVAYVADTVSAHMRMLQALVSRSRAWSAWSRSHAARQTSWASPTAHAFVAASAQHPYALTRTGFNIFLPEAIAAMQQQHPELTLQEARSAASALWTVYKARAVRQAQQQQQQQEQGQEPEQRQALPSTNPWPLQYSRNVSGRMLLRMEFLLATGQDDQVSMAVVFRLADAKWTQQFPEFRSWVQLRLQHLQQDPGDWHPVLLQKAVKWYSANGGTTAADAACQASAAGSRAAATRAQEGAAAKDSSSKPSSRRGRGA